MSVSLKLRQLESKISTLQTQHQTLLKDRQQEIAGLITSLELAHVEDNLLIGVLLFLKDKITTQDPTGLTMVEAWRDAGDRFLRRKQKKSPRIFSENTAPSKAATTSNPKPKLSESHTQQRKEQDAKTTELTT
ncbi:MAG: hypothetical protein K2X28_05900 [Alphaproteobacteria bacterium]|nr:hypothetical protein [Alphaproteobacteria bacterium]